MPVCVIWQPFPAQQTNAEEGDMANENNASQNPNPSEEMLTDTQLEDRIKCRLVLPFVAVSFGVSFQFNTIKCDVSAWAIMCGLIKHGCCIWSMSAGW